MKYMLMMHSNTKAFAEMTAWSQQDVQAMIQFMDDLNAELAASGEVMDAQGLGHPDSARIVQARHDDEPVITDGPFPEAKEMLAGYWLLDVRDEARALELAARISACPGAGGVPVNQPITVQQVLDAPEA
ncbi:MAG: YciI family protein [Kibdelosporangium sp.]